MPKLTKIVVAKMWACIRYATFRQFKANLMGKGNKISNGNKSSNRNKKFKLNEKQQFEPSRF